MKWMWLVLVVLVLLALAVILSGCAAPRGNLEPLLDRLPEVVEVMSEVQKGERNALIGLTFIRVNVYVNLSNEDKWQLPLTVKVKR